MKRILFFIESLSGGGAEKVLVTLLKHIDYKQYDVTLLSLVDTGVLRDEIDKDKVHFISIIKSSNKVAINLWNNIIYKLLYYYIPSKFVNKLIIPQKGIDVYIAFTEGYATKILASSPQKKIAWVHIDLQSLPWTQNLHVYKSLQEEKETYKKYDKIICVSNSVNKVMNDYYGLYNTLTIYNPIDVGNIIMKSNQPVESINSSTFKIVSIGRLEYQKGYDLLIPIIARLRHRGVNVQLYILGEGSQRNNLDQLIKQLDLKDIVHLCGFIKNPYPLMKQMDLFVCSSRAEGYSLVIAEALVLGLPILSMNCAGPNELLDDGEYGFLCNTYSELENSIEKSVNDFSFYMDLQKRAFKRQSFFSVSSTMNQIEKMIDSL